MGGDKCFAVSSHLDIACIVLLIKHLVIDLLCSHTATARPSEVSASHSLRWIPALIFHFRTARQEKLLQGIMTEIVRMTSQMHPLEMGVPLYPFSHSGVFPIQKDGELGESAGAPLPDSSSYPDDQSSSSPASIRTFGATPPISTMGGPVPPPQAQVQVPALDVMGWHPRASGSPAGRVMVGGMHATHSTYPH